MSAKHTTGPWTPRLAHSESEARLQGEYARLQEQRNELLAALRCVVTWLEHNPRPESALAVARAAIALAEGKK